MEVVDRMLADARSMYEAVFGKPFVRREDGRFSAFVRMGHDAVTLLRTHLEALRTYLSMYPAIAARLGVRWAPPVDVIETDESIRIRFDVPGVARVSVRVIARDRVIAVVGERVSNHHEPDARLWMRERICGPFERSVVLPFPFNTGDVRATLQDGVLQVVVPKTSARAEPSTHEIRVE